jgi:hypothetical protein
VSEKNSSRKVDLEIPAKNPLPVRISGILKNK